MDEKIDPLKFNDSIHDSLPFIDQTTIPTLRALLESFLRELSSETALAMAEYLEKLSKDGNFLGASDSIVQRSVQIQENSLRALAAKLPTSSN